MKAHIGVDAESGLVHTVVGTAANVNDVTQADNLLHGQETGGDAGMSAPAGRQWVSDEAQDELPTSAEASNSGRLVASSSFKLALRPTCIRSRPLADIPQPGCGRRTTSVSNRAI